MLGYETASGAGNLSIYVVSRTYPNSAVSCEYEDDVFASLGQTAVVGVIGSCTLTAAADESLRVVLTLVSSTGERVNLNEDVYTVVAGGQESFNVSIDAWDPDAGFFSVELSAHDRYGRELEHISESVVARENGGTLASVPCQQMRHHH